MRVLLLVLLAGCDVVFGLTGGLHQHDAATIDAPTNTVTGRLVLRSVVLVGGLPTDTETFWPGVVMSVRFDDGTTIPVEYHDTDGTFSFTRRTPNETYRLQIIEPEDTITYQHSAPHLELVDRSAGRRPRVTVTMPTTITYQLGATIPGFTLVSSTGLWTIGVGSGGTGNFTYRWDKASSLGGPIGLLDASKGDTLYLTDMIPISTTHFAIGAQSVTQITQSNGGNTVVNAPAFSSVGRESCAHIKAPRGLELTRVGTVAEGPFEFSGTDWAIVAMPSRDQAGLVGFLNLAQPQDTTATDFDWPMIDFHNPYPGTQLALTSGVLYRRTFQPPTATTSIPLDIGTRGWAPLTTGPTCATNFAAVLGGNAIPQTIELAGQRLDVDDRLIALTPADPVVDWKFGANESADATALQLFEVTIAAGVPKLDLVLRIQTATTSVRIDRALLTPNKRYLIRLDTDSGLPNAAVGDFGVLTYPFAHATNWSHSFQIAP